MKVLGLSLLLLVSVGGDPARDGVRLYAEGKFAEAVAAFQKALAADPDSPRLNYNLALALWRQGDADAAETAAEKAAALAGGAFDHLRDGILGNLRYDRARAVAAKAATDPQKEVEVLEQAVQLAGTARDLFQGGAGRALARDPGAGAELLRNLERAIKLEAELKERLAAAKKKREEQQKKSDQDKKQDQKDKQDKQDPDKQEGKTKDPDQDNKDDKQDPDRKKEERQKDPEQKDQQKPQQDKQQDEQENQPHQAPKPQQVPGEHDPDKELSPEQKRQLLKKLQEFEENLQKLKAARKAARPKVKKDW